MIAFKWHRCPTTSLKKCAFRVPAFLWIIISGIYQSEVRCPNEAIGFDGIGRDHMKLFLFRPFCFVFLSSKDSPIRLWLVVVSDNGRLFGVVVVSCAA